MRVATLNLMGGRSISDGELHPRRLARAVELLDADVLAVQEVDRNQPRSHGRDLTAEIAEAMGAVDARFEPTVIGTPGQRWRPARPEDPEADTAPTYGIALVSRRPVTQWHVVPLRAAPLYAPVTVPGPRGMRVVVIKDEPRALLAATVEADSGPVLIGATHLSFVPGWNMVQARRAVKELQARPAAHRLLVGDLNLPGRWAERATGWHRIAEHRTWPSPDPTVQFDHVLAESPMSTATSQSRWLPISDHRAIHVDLEEF